MAADIEALIAEAARAGRLGAVTLWPTAGGWQANVRDAKTSGWCCKMSTDPVTALRAALGGAAIVAVVHPPAEKVQDEDVFG